MITRRAVWLVPILLQICAVVHTGVGPEIGSTTQLIAYITVPIKGSGDRSDAASRIAEAIKNLPVTGGSIVLGFDQTEEWESCPFKDVISPVTLDLGTATHSISTNCVVPSNVTLDFSKGGLISPDASTTFTIGGGMLGPIRQRFAGDGTVTFAETVNIQSVYPQWWGGEAKESVDITEAINSATAAAHDGRVERIIFPYRPECYMTQGIKFYSDMTFEPGARGTCIKKSGGSVAMPIFDPFDNGDTSYSNVTWLPGFVLDGNKGNQTDARNRIGIKLQGTTDVLIDGIDIRNCALDSIMIYGSGPNRTIPSNRITIRNSRLTGGTRTNLAVTTVQDLLVEDTLFSDAGGASPGSNIDIEPDGPDDTIKDLTFKNITVTGAASNGLTIAPVGIDRIDANIFISGTFTDNRGWAIEVLNNPYRFGPIHLENVRTVRNGSNSGGIDLNRTFKAVLNNVRSVETGTGLNIARNNQSVSVNNSFFAGGLQPNTWDFIIGDASTLDTFIGSDVQFLNERFQDTGVRTAWERRYSRFTIMKVQNGESRCSNPDGCWSTNGGATWVHPASKANPQIVPFFRIGTKSVIYEGSIWNVIPISGVTAATITLGNLTNPSEYLKVPFDLMTAPSQANALAFATNSAFTDVPEFLRFSIAFTGGDSTTVAAGSTFVISILWGTDVNQ
jgi:hypothetical protein